LGTEYAGFLSRTYLAMMMDVGVAHLGVSESSEMGQSNAKEPLT